MSFISFASIDKGRQVAVLSQKLSLRFCFYSDKLLLTLSPVSCAGRRVQTLVDNVTKHGKLRSLSILCSLPLLNITVYWDVCCTLIRTMLVYIFCTHKQDSGVSKGRRIDRREGSG